MVRSLNSIVAVCQNMGIGKDGNLPWPPLRNEYKYFQRMTSTCQVEGKQNALIMGKKTWFSIPEKNRPLKDRINIVLSRELKETPKGAHYLSKNLDDALALLDSPELKSKVDMVWIIGGTSVYKVVKDSALWGGGSTDISCLKYCEEQRKVNLEQGGHTSAYVCHVHPVFSSLLWETVSCGP
ncbi:dihydrofolate reductase isoform X2 [Pezoporus wallicus]|uniref:dihydrofolate reductase isoform X2 n=1 Tax=Pezoporus wallicus TaxID=35540 RepID=UPI00254DD978|nr:dihydrofolate reductase isoform X2 [Pezoporus wallicus]XP_061334739.1 dihydrofolate reductase isoform X2 [Pezoporus flaviventris]